MAKRWRTCVLLAAVALAVLTPVSAVRATDDEPVLVVPGDASDGRLRISPDVQAADATGRVAWVLTNGGPDADLRLRVHDVVVEDVPTLGERLSQIRIDRDRLHLATGESARVAVSSLPATPSGFVALVVEASGRGPGVEASAIATNRPLAPVSVAAVELDGSRAVIRLDTDGPSVVDVAVQWSGLLRGAVASDVIDRLVVPAGGRRVEVSLGGIGGLRTTVDVAVRVAGSDDVARGSASTWAPIPVAVAVLAALVVVAVGGWVLQASRRRGGSDRVGDRRGQDELSPDGPG